MSGFNFKCVTSDYILRLLNKLNARKATGFDNIPPKLLRLGSDIICTPLTVLCNSSITTSSFPDMLKRAEVTPIYKNNDLMDLSVSCPRTSYHVENIRKCINKSTK